jgi:hypothetical protein
MNSGGHRGFTVVTVVTLIFAPIFSHHHWMWRLVGKTNETHVEQCVVKQPCPRHTRIVNIVTLPQPPASPGGGKHDKGSNDENSGDTNGVLVDNPASVDAGDGNDNDQQDPKGKH